MSPIAFQHMCGAKPVASFAIRNNLVLLMAKFGRGRTRGDGGVQQRIHQVYNKTLCPINIGKEGRPETTYLQNGTEC